MDKVDKIISIIRTLKEDGAMMGAPTNSVGDGGLTSKGETLAGYDKPLDGRSRMMRRLPPAYRKSIQKGKSNKNK